MASPLAVKEPWDLVATDYTAEVAPEFEHFARRAIELAALPAGSRVVDVATGPGTLALLAARQGHRVSALDFSPKMIAELERRLAAEPGLQVEARVGDGMALPFEDASFDGAFSMFGLMFFPDRARGFAELYRVLAPGRRAVISSWPPLERLPQLSAVFGTLNELRPPPPGTPPFKPALGTPEECTAEFAAAGFSDVQVHEVTHVSTAPSITALWESFQRSTAPIVLMKRSLGDAWPELAAQVLARLREKFGDGPQNITMPAYVSVGTR